MDKLLENLCENLQKNKSFFADPPVLKATALFKSKLRSIIAGGKYFMHMGTRRIWLAEFVITNITGAVRELCDAEFCFFHCGGTVCLVQANSAG